MNGTKIEYVLDTYNPVSGCRYRCPYCYARDIAGRFAGCLASPDGKTDQEIIILDYPTAVMRRTGRKMLAPYPYGFTPTLHRYRLDWIGKRKNPRSTLVCSMADLFGPWVPDDWIFNVFDACVPGLGPYLFLTKNPGRYGALADAGALPRRDDFWYGTSVPVPGVSIFNRSGYHTWLSMEPLLESFEGRWDTYKDVPWIVLGAETGHRPDKVLAEKRWVRDLVDWRQIHGLPVFMKGSMKEVWREDLLQEKPWKEAQKHGKKRVPGASEADHTALETGGA